MSLKDLRTPHLSLLSTASVRYGFRSGTGIVFAVISLITGLMIAQIFLGNLDALERKARESAGRDFETKELVDQVIEHIGRPAVEWALAGDKKWAAFFLDENPALLSGIFLVLLFALPFLVAMGAFNQMSGDIQSKGLRFLLLRTERANLFFGRFLGNYLFCIAVFVAIVLVIAVFAGFKVKIYSWGEILPLFLRSLFALCVLALPYAALGSWISASIASPFASLFVTKLIVGGVPLFAALASGSWEPAGYAAYLIPWGVKFHLLHPSLGTVLLAMAACLGYTAVYLALGYRSFSKRDL